MDVSVNSQVSSSAARRRRSASGDPAGQAAEILLKGALAKLTNNWSSSVFDPIMSLLTGSGSLDGQILQELQQVEEQLVAMNQALQQLQQSVTELQEEVLKDTYQQRLQDYETQRSVITTNFTSLVNAMVGLASSDSATRNQAMDEFNSLVSITTADQVAEAMRDLHVDISGDPSVGFKGFIPYQIEILQDAIQQYCASSSIQIVPGMEGAVEAWAYGPGSTVNGADDPDDIPYGGTFYDCFRCITQPPTAVLSQLIQGTIIPAYNAMLSVQTQALFFLYTAWNGTPQAGQLQSLVDDINQEIDAMKSLFSYFQGSDYDDFMLGVLQKNAQSPSVDYLTRMWPLCDASNQNPSWPYGDGWVWFNAGGQQAVLRGLTRSSSPPACTAQLVTFTKATNAPMAEFYEIYYGWNWGGLGTTSLPLASASAGAVVTPLMNQFLQGLSS